MKRAKRALSAVGLKRIFIASIVAMILLLIFGFSWLSSRLEERAMQADHTQIDAEIARGNIDHLQFLESYLEDNRETVDRAEAIVTEASQFQQQVVNDINSFAAVSGVTVLGYNFEVEDEASTSSISGTNATSVTVTLANPIAYVDFLRFLQAIEQNLTRMQVTGVTLSPNSDDPNQVSNPQVGLEVFLKEEN